MKDWEGGPIHLEMSSTTQHHSLPLTTTHYHPLTTTHYSLLTTHTTQYSILTTHYSPLTTHYSPLSTTHYHSLPLTITHYHSLLLTITALSPITITQYHYTCLDAVPLIQAANKPPNAVIVVAFVTSLVPYISSSRATHVPFLDVGSRQFPSSPLR